MAVLIIISPLDGSVMKQRNKTATNIAWFSPQTICRYNIDYSVSLIYLTALAFANFSKFCILTNMHESALYVATNVAT